MKKLVNRFGYKPGSLKKDQRNVGWERSWLAAYGLEDAFVVI